MISTEEKHAHFVEIQDTARRHGEQREAIFARASVNAGYDRRIAPPRPR